MAILNLLFSLYNLLKIRALLKEFSRVWFSGFPVFSLFRIITGCTSRFLVLRASFQSCCCCSVAELCLTETPWLCMPGLPVLHHLRKPAQTHVHWVGDASQPSHVHWVGDASQPSHLCHHLLLLPSIFPSIRLFTSGGKSIGASALASILPVNIQG